MVKASGIIPTYIEKCFKRIAKVKVMEVYGEPFEIVISEDESTDLLRDTSLSRLYITRREG